MTREGNLPQLPGPEEGDVATTRFRPLGGNEIKLVFSFEAIFGIPQPAVISTHCAANMAL